MYVRVFVNIRIPFLTCPHTSNGKSKCALMLLQELLVLTEHAKDGKGKGKPIPLQAWTCPEGSRRLRFPDFTTIGT